MSYVATKLLCYLIIYHFMWRIKNLLWNLFYEISLPLKYIPKNLKCAYYLLKSFLQITKRKAFLALSVWQVFSNTLYMDVDKYRCTASHRSKTLPKLVDDSKPYFFVEQGTLLFTGNGAFIMCVQIDHTFYIAQWHTLSVLDIRDDNYFSEIIYHNVST